MTALSSLRWMALGCGVVLLFASVIAGVKLLPFAFKSGVAFESIGPLAAAAFATVCEISWLLGTAPGLVFAQQRIGGAGVQLAVGSGLLRRRITSALPPLLLWSLLSAALGSWVNVELAAPGRVANGLLETAREACGHGGSAKTVTIPVLGSRWHCRPDGAPTLVGEFYHASSGVTYSARDMNVSDDMTYVELSQLKLESKALPHRLGLRLAVEGAKLRGLWPLARPARLGAVGRASLVSVTAALLAGTLLWALGARRMSPWLAAFLGLVASVVPWFWLMHLDHNRAHSALTYVSVPLVGAGIGIFCGWLLRSTRLERAWRRVVTASLRR